MAPCCLPLIIKWPHSEGQVIKNIINFVFWYGLILLSIKFKIAKSSTPELSYLLKSSFCDSDPPRSSSSSLQAYIRDRPCEKLQCLRFRTNRTMTLPKYGTESKDSKLEHIHRGLGTPAHSQAREANSNAYAGSGRVDNKSSYCPIEAWYTQSFKEERWKPIDYVPAAKVDSSKSGKAHGSPGSSTKATQGSGGRN